MARVLVSLLKFHFLALISDVFVHISLDHLRPRCMGLLMPSKFVLDIHNIILAHDQYFSATYLI